MRKKIFVDFDSTLVNTIKRITELYNEDFAYYKNFCPVDWSEIETWDFQELKLAPKGYVDSYFCQPRFFDENLEMYDRALTALYLLNVDREIVIVSMGSYANLELKKIWCKLHLPFAKFIGCSLDDYADKSHIYMNGAIFIDDRADNLYTSNADLRICFGDIYEWNKDWKGIRCYNWGDVWRSIQKAENEERGE